MVAITFLSDHVTDDRRSELIFSGDLLVFRDVEPLRAFVDLTDGLVREALGDQPQRAHLEYGGDQFDRRVESLQREYRRHPQVAGAFRDVLEAAGGATGRSCWDWLYLRVQPPGGTDGSRTLGYHRDTWSSNVYAQTNWWTPIYPIAAQRTVAFYPRYWTEPLANTSAGWDLMRLREIPLVPEPSEPVDVSGELRVVIRPGDLLCFSGAHLHASVPNTTDRTRFSVEVRTVNRDDVRAGRGAPNVDGHAPHVAWRWFRGITDGAPLADGR